MKLQKFICLTLILFSALSFSNVSRAQGVDAESMSKDNQAPPEVEAKPEEEAPPVEAPYPNVKKEEPATTPVTPAPTRPKSVQKKLGIPHRVAPSGTQTQLNIEKPKSIDEDGNYIYEKSKVTDETDVSNVPTKPVDHGKEGPLKITRPIEVKKNGDYFYGYEKTPHNYSASLKFGLFPAPHLTNANTKATFSQLYSDNYVGTLMFDYEKQFHRSFGDLGIRLGSGLFYANGNGRFVDQSDPDRAPGTVPDVSFNFIMMPNTLVGLYHMRYWDTQIFTPYFGGGGGYFIFSELRDDGRPPKFGGAAVLTAVAGINIMIDGFDARSARELESSYGVSHVFLNFEFTQFIGLNSLYDFTGSVGNAGFNLEF